MNVEIDTLIRLKYGSPMDPMFTRFIPAEIVESALVTLSGATMSESMPIDMKRQVLWILLRQPRTKEVVEEFLNKALIEYENRRRYL